MKYHYQRGITQKDKKGHKKTWLGFFVAITLVAYSGLLFTVLDLNGWPVSGVDTTAKIVKTTKPGDNKIFIPAINVSADAKAVKISGDPSYSDVTVSGPSFGVGVTPTSLRQASPFYNVDQLKDGDEIFLDDQGTRYVYKVSESTDEDEQKLTIKGKNKTIIAKTIGTIAWNDGKPSLESF